MTDGANPDGEGTGRVGAGPFLDPGATPKQERGSHSLLRHTSLDIQILGKTSQRQRDHGGAAFHPFNSCPAGRAIETSFVYFFFNLKYSII